MGIKEWGSFFLSRIGMVLVAFIAIVLALGIYEHRAHIFGSQAALLVLLLLCPLMHLFMHGGHGGHKHHGRDGDAGQGRQE